MNRIRLFLAAVTVAGFAATAAHGQAVTVLGGGMARLCSYAALAGDFDTAAEANCTAALTTEVLSPLDRAGTLVNRGVMKLRRKDFAAARADFDSALRAKADLGEAFLNRGAAALGARRFADSPVGPQPRHRAGRPGAREGVLQSRAGLREAGPAAGGVLGLQQGDRAQARVAAAPHRTRPSVPGHAVGSASE